MLHRGHRRPGREIVPHCRRNIVYCDNLLLEGLRLLYEKNTGKKVSRL